MNMIARLIQKEMAELFLLETKKVPGVLISVTEVRISPDLSLARIFLSIFPNEKAEEIMKGVRENNSRIRYDFGKRVGQQLRVIPELEFVQDKSEEMSSRIDELLKK